VTDEQANGDDVTQKQKYRLRLKQQWTMLNMSGLFLRLIRSSTHLKI